MRLDPGALGTMKPVAEAMQVTTMRALKRVMVGSGST